MIKMDKILKLLKIERECVGRNCNRECAMCELVQKQSELLEMFTDVINILEAKAAVPHKVSEHKWYCGNCGCRIPLKKKPKFCIKCGAPILFNTQITKATTTSEY